MVDHGNAYLQAKETPVSIFIRILAGKQRALSILGAFPLIGKIIYYRTLKILALFPDWRLTVAPNFHKKAF